MPTYYVQVQREGEGPQQSCVKLYRDLDIELQIGFEFGLAPSFNPSHSPIVRILTQDWPKRNFHTAILAPVPDKVFDALVDHYCWELRKE